MYIFIDESGPFSVPLNRKLSISCAGALVVPEATYGALATAFAGLSASWPKDKGEIKGKLLSEKHIASAVGLFADHGVLFDCIAIDLGLHRVQEIEAHRNAQAARLTANLTPRHQPQLVAEVQDLAVRLGRLTSPSYVQLLVLTGLVERVLATKVLYFAQAAPAEIGTFRWVIDAKDKRKSEYETLWEILVLPWLESRSIRSPMLQLEGADYSAFMRFDAGLTEPPEEHLPLMPDWKPGMPFAGTNIRLVMEEHRSFRDSRGEIGLQMADVMTNAVARSMKGNLQRSAWQTFGRVMLRQPEGREVVGLIHLHSASRQWKQSPPYDEVLLHLRRAASPVLVSDVDRETPGRHT